MSKELIFAFIEENKEEFISLSRKIWENPELGHKEFKACKWLTNELKKHNFEVELGTGGLETGFRGVYDSKLPGPTVAYLCEYDALPEIGHACGHNLIGVMSLAAGISLSKVIKETGGKVIVFGTPAEETSGAKVTYAEQGLFDTVDVALMAHPSQNHERSGTSKAMDAIQFDFYGKSAHAASHPEDGVNALDAVIQTFTNINALRQQTTDDARIHGIISHGGVAPNIIVDRAQAQFYVRTKQMETLVPLVERVINCAKGAALATGCRLEVSRHEFSYANLITNETLSNVYNDNLIKLGVIEEEIKTGLKHGSNDMGNVSHKVPSIHPYIKVPNAPYPVHTTEFREAAGSEDGMKTLILGAKTLAATGYDILTKKELLEKIKEEFETTRGNEPFQAIL
ncbi:M20 family metallopeptidase [Neobacillus sp. YIM B06451]|uniref:M20 family metallopeptidase n=1 Tax=Neobacillus sp. YIM B06451 TaxID=3070994 RepID=UPI00292F6E72|nr:M20 family metallopeptidase [Neobacillus sp. YIM B06451]